MKTEDRGASGRIELRFHSEESGSTHRYNSSGVWLSAIDASTLLLETSSFEHEANSRSESDRTSGIAISVSDLIDLIRKHGKPVSKSKPVRKKFKKRPVKKR